MPKSAKIKFYAVATGRDGPAVYKSWDECKDKVSRYPGAVHKSFPSQKQAEEWLASHLANTPRHPAPKASEPAAGSPMNGGSNRSTSKNTSPTLLELLDELVPPLSTPDPVSTPNIVVLSPEQNTVLSRVKDGRNVFFTGSAGTGKSVLLREIIRVVGGSASPTLGITASTGIASVNIGGTTLHSWAGVGLGQETAKNLVGKFFGQKKFAQVLERWRRVKTLIIDEVSMIDGDLFDKLEYIARNIRKIDKPFGGIQLVLSGDFCQLPPVPDRKDGAPVMPTFAFDAKTWDDCVGPPVTLTRVFRQKDQAFVDMLNAMRLGVVNTNITNAFKQLSRKVQYTDGIEPTELFATRMEVDNANSSRLRQLPGDGYIYKAQQYPGIDSKGERITEIQMERLLERLVAPKSIQLKVGAQVMLIKNLIQGELVNGSVGQVIKFITPAEAVKEHLEIITKEGAEADPNMEADGSRWPVVRFTNGMQKMCIPQEFTVNNAEGGMEARRDQIPLILAWALSVHKSQGQTLERVKVDLKRTFEKGQAYVALSRATCMEQLQVLNFDPSKVSAHPRVLAWHGATHDSEMYFDEDEMDNEDALEAYYTM